MSIGLGSDYKDLWGIWTGSGQEPFLTILDQDRIWTELMEKNCSIFL